MVEKQGFKQKTINWLRNRNNQVFLGILLFAFVIRIYYFIATKGQNLWWDEAEYMNMARAWAFNINYNYWIPVRPVLFPLISSVLLQIHNTEFLPRMFILFLSMASIVGMYYLGKEFYNRKTGLIASFLVSVFYLAIFHTYRLLVDLPSLAFFIFSALFFVKYFKTRKSRFFYIASIIVAFGTLIRITTTVLLFVILVYIITTEKFRFIKRKEYWISAVIFWLILTPYLIWGYNMFGGFVISQAGAWNAPKEVSVLSNGFSNLKEYLSMFPFIFSWTLTILFIFGIMSMYRLFLGFDKLFKREIPPRIKRDLFVFLLFIIPLIVVSFSLANTPEDRYIFLSMPSIFMIVGNILLKIPRLNLFRHKKKMACVVILILLGMITFYQFQQTSSLIESKSSFNLMKQTGDWIQMNSNEYDLIFTTSHPMIAYYSQRETLAIPATKEEFLHSLDEHKNAQYFILIDTRIQKSPDWAYSYPIEANLSVANVYFLDEEASQPILVVYQL